MTRSKSRANYLKRVANASYLLYQASVDYKREGSEINKEVYEKRRERFYRILEEEAKGNDNKEPNH